MELSGEPSHGVDHVDADVEERTSTAFTQHPKPQRSEWTGPDVLMKRDGEVAKCSDRPRPDEMPEMPE
jgi:hypothetical protein